MAILLPKTLQCMDFDIIVTTNYKMVQTWMQVDLQVQLAEL